MRRSNPLTLLAFAAFVATGGAAAQSASELVAEGNDLVRSGVYRTALLRYREAAAAGLDTQLLHYNLGVVHYKLAEFDRAAEEFGRAVADPALAALATFNRGLAQRASGDRAAAAESFRDAAERADDRDLRRLAEDAATAQTSAAVAETRPARGAVRSAPEADGQIGEFRLMAAAQMGQDDNVYRTPADPYVDLADPTQPLVTPTPHSAAFMPAELRAAYVLENESGDTDFLFRYDVEGAFYGTEFSNATELDQRFSMGADILLGERERRRREVETAFFVRSHSETNFDPDDGLARDIDGEDISDRFSYTASGVEGVFGHTLGRWHWGFDLRFERREYDRTVPVANFDHEYFFTGVDIAYDFSDVMTLTAGLRQYRRLYDERPARDLTGALLVTNPAQQYTYSGIQLGVTRQLGRTIELDADYVRLDRTDEFLGYYDYTEDVLRVRATFRPTSRFDLSLAVVARSYDYPRAFAFNVAAGGVRELEELGAELHGEFHLTRRLTLSAGLDTLDVTSTDARAEYAGTRTMLGVEWRR